MSDYPKIGGTVFNLTPSPGARTPREIETRPITRSNIYGAQDGWLAQLTARVGRSEHDDLHIT